MGSFWGHIDGGIFFIIISVWWMCNIYTEYIRKKGKTHEIKLPLAYPLPWKQHIPGEIYFKIAFPLVGFIIEFLADGFFNFVDDDGNFQNVQNIQHMGIYGMFVLHGLTDLFLWLGWPVVRDAHLLTVVLAFTWYGVSFFFHAHMHGKEPLESIVHLLPMPVIFGAAACGVAKLLHREGVAIPLAYAYFVLTLGTWFSHVPFMLYSVNPFPGRESSGWDRNDPRNVAFAVGMFGAHLCFNIIFTWVLYIVIYVVMTRNGKGDGFSSPYKDENSKYQMLSMCDVDVSSTDSAVDNGYYCGVVDDAFSGL